MSTECPRRELEIGEDPAAEGGAARRAGCASPRPPTNSSLQFRFSASRATLEPPRTMSEKKDECPSQARPRSTVQAEGLRQQPHQWCKGQERAHSPPGFSPSEMRQASHPRRTCNIQAGSGMVSEQRIHVLQPNSNLNKKVTATPPRIPLTSRLQGEKTGCSPSHRKGRVFSFFFSF